MSRLWSYYTTKLYFLLQGQKREEEITFSHFTFIFFIYIFGRVWENNKMPPRVKKPLILIMFYILPKNFILSKLIFLGGEMIMDQATISSYVGLIIMPILGYFAVSETTSSAIVGVVSAVIFLLLQIWNEKNNSNIISGKKEEDDNVGE